MPRLFDELAPLGLPMLCAGGVGDEKAFVAALEPWATPGCRWAPASSPPPNAAPTTTTKTRWSNDAEDDIVLTERLTGVPVAVIRTPYVDRLGTKAGPLARWLLKGRKTKHWMRMIYSLQSLWKLKRSLHRSYSSKDFLQAGRSVAGIDRVEPTAAILARFHAAALAAPVARRRPRQRPRRPPPAQPPEPAPALRYARRHTFSMRASGKSP